MNHTRARAFVLFSTLGILAACERPGSSDITKDFEELPSARRDLPAPPVVATSVASKASAPASSSAPAPASASSSGAPAAAGSGSGAPVKVAKTYECGEKGKPDCPMQRWMKSVAGGAAMSGDANRLKSAFLAMSKAPPGMGGWASLCATGAAKAGEGDIDGAKAMCKACHGKYQAAYHANMRDMAWP